MSSKWAPAQAPDGRTYYYHTETKQVTWEKPADYDAPATPSAPPEDVDADPANWGEAKAGDGRTYYYNKKSQKTVWEKPAALQQVEQQQSGPPAFVAGGPNGFAGRHESDAQDYHRDDRGHGLPQKPSFDGPRGTPWGEQQQQQQRGGADATGFRGGMPVKADEPEYSSPEAAEEAFFSMLKRAEITADTSWRDALASVGREREYRALKDPKDRKQAFERYCQMVRVQEKEKEKERRERQRVEYREMLSTHPEIQPYTRWRTVRPLIEREAVYKSMGDDEDRRRIFEEYVWDLKKSRAEQTDRQHKKAREDLATMLQALIVDPETKWEDAHTTITTNDGFRSSDVFHELHDKDIFQAYERHVKALERVANDERQKERSLRVRRERNARDNFLQLLGKLMKQGKIQADTKWQDFYPLIADDERYLAYLGMPGSSPLDLFRDIVVDEEQRLRSKRHRAIDVLHELQYEVNVDTTYEEFAKVMHSHPSTKDLMTDHQMRLVYQHVLNKVKPRKEVHDANHVQRQQDAADSLRHQMRKLEPPVRLEDRYEDVMQRLSSFRAYEIADETTRRSAFDRFHHRLQEKENEHPRERSRRERDHDRDHRNGSRSRRDHDRDRERDRDRDRDRQRRHRSRSPEIDAYQADRLKAQADRERQYRKPSFGLSPPPRDRRDDRHDRDRRSDRYEGSMSVYDRERRERELERERSYVTRADPRDKGKTLDYGDDDSGSRPASINKRRGSEASASSRRDPKRTRRERSTRSPEVQTLLKEEPPALQSGSEEGEIEEL